MPPIKIENPKGSVRSGVGPDGKPWSVTMPDHYGYFTKTEARDGDEVDVHIGPNPDSDKVFVVDQKDLQTGKFDEPKTFVGYNSKLDVFNAYNAGFSDGKGPYRIGAITETTKAGLKEWMDKEASKKPFAVSAPSESVIKRYPNEEAAKADLVPLKPGDVAPVRFDQLQSGAPHIGWYEPIKPFQSNDGGIYYPAESGKVKITSGQLERAGFKIPPEELEKFKAAGGVIRPEKPAEAAAPPQKPGRTLQQKEVSGDEQQCPRFAAASHHQWRYDGYRDERSG